jgi:hypothetical protein
MFDALESSADAHIGAMWCSSRRDFCHGLLGRRGRESMIKTLIRMLCLGIMLSGWLMAGLCLHVVRVPNPRDAMQSQWLILPKFRLGIYDTYVDARQWKMADAAEHPELISRVLESGDCDKFKFLADPKSSQSIQAQLTAALSGSKSTNSFEALENIRLRQSLNDGKHSPVVVELTF